MVTVLKLEIRIRKIKCDEKKPFCQKCVKTRRACDGYGSPFRLVTGQSIIHNAHIGGVKSETRSEQPTQSIVTNIITSEDVNLLNRCLSTKTIFDVKLDCDDEARQILQASMDDPPIRHAVCSLLALRGDLERTTAGGGDRTASSIVKHARTTQIRSCNHGLQHYGMALSSLASRLASSSSSSPATSPSSSSNAVKSALLCCQIFISIEQVRGNHAAMAQHIIRGLRIMHEYRARPGIAVVHDPAATDKKALALVPASHNPLPLLDVFLIKLFAAPCPFIDPPPIPASTPAKATANDDCDDDDDDDERGHPPSASFIPVTSPHHQTSINHPPQRQPRTLLPNMRTHLTALAKSTLTFLENISHIDSIPTALTLLLEKRDLLKSLEVWLVELENLLLIVVHLEDPKKKNKEQREEEEEPVSVSFMRFFHQILKCVILGQLTTTTTSSSSSSSSTSPSASTFNSTSQHIEDENDNDNDDDADKEEEEILKDLRIEYERLQDVADAVGERIRKAY